jgi:hypothetical protein
MMLDAGLWPDNLAGRQRTPEAIGQAMQTPLRIAMSLQRVIKPKPLIQALEGQNIHTLFDLFGTSFTDREYDLFKHDHPQFLLGAAAAFAKPLQVLPETALAFQAAYGRLIGAPAFANDPTGLQHEAAMRVVVEDMLTRLPARHALFLTLQHLYEGTGLNERGVIRRFGIKRLTHEGIRQIRLEINRYALAPYGPTETISRQELLGLALGPDYEQALASIERLKQNEHDIQAFHQQIVTLLTAWPVVAGRRSKLSELGNLLHGLGSGLSSEIPLLALRLTPTEDTKAIRLQVGAFNRFIEKLCIAYNQKRSNTVGDIRAEAYTGTEDSISEEAIIAKGMFAR